jgi:AcrR family transcriptional regulator
MTETSDPTQQRLLDAAEQVFADKGFNAASIRDICRKAGANVAAVNYYFRDKERLYIETVKYAYRACIQGMPFPEWGPGVEPRQKLGDFIRVVVTRIMQPSSTASLQLMMRELAQPTAACAEVVRDYIQPMAERLRSILSELFPEVPEKESFFIGFSIMGQCLFYRHHRAVAALLVGEEEFQKLTTEQIIRHITSFTFAALGLANGAHADSPALRLIPGEAAR